MNKSLLKIFCEMRLQTEFNCDAFQYKLYQTGETESIYELENMMSLLTTPEQKVALDMLIGIYDINASNYGLTAYERGFKDGIQLMIELNNLVTENE